MNWVLLFAAVAGAVGYMVGAWLGRRSEARAALANHTGAFAPEDQAWAEHVAGSYLAERQIRAAIAKPDPDDAVLAIYVAVDAAFRAGHFDAVDAVLGAVAVDTFAVDVLLALLSITTTAIDKLPSRAAFAGRFRDRLAREDPEQVDALLAGLEGT